MSETSVCRMRITMTVGWLTFLICWAGTRNIRWRRGCWSSHNTPVEMAAAGPGGENGLTRENSPDSPILGRCRSKPTPQEARRAIISDRPYPWTPEGPETHTSPRLRWSRYEKGPYREKAAPGLASASLGAWL